MSDSAFGNKCMDCGTDIDDDKALCQVCREGRLIANQKELNSVIFTDAADVTFSPLSGRNITHAFVYAEVYKRKHWWSLRKTHFQELKWAGALGD